MYCVKVYPFYKVERTYTLYFYHRGSVAQFHLHRHIPPFSTSSYFTFSPFLLCYVFFIMLLLLLFSFLYKYFNRIFSSIMLCCFSFFFSYLARNMGRYYYFHFSFSLFFMFSFPFSCSSFSLFVPIMLSFLFFLFFYFSHQPFLQCSLHVYLGTKLGTNSYLLVERPSKYILNAFF
uniref:Uncharacterized protein n=2 Tax=Cacopsylla melanoneura TaxID=428564 RepID=A0A8D9AIX0_9HEMI